MNQDQYIQLNQFKDVVTHYVKYDTLVGCDLQKLKSIYEPIYGDKVDLGCGGCVDTMLRNTHQLLEEHGRR